jgi:hypothetical protein
MSFTKNDNVTRDVVNQLQSNYQWINDNAPRGRFYGDERIIPDVKSVIACGRVVLHKNKNQDNAQASVQFGKAFAADCRPHVTTGIISTSRKDVFVIIGGPGGFLAPTASGFTLKLVVLEENRDTDKDFWIAWHAYGYNTGEIV